MTIDQTKMLRAIVNAGEKGEWYRIRNEAGGSRAVVHLYDAIGGWFGVTAKDFVSEITALDVDEIELHINSPGGSVYDDIAIRNSLKSHRARVTAVVDGLAASAASFIALAGDEVVMAPNSELMIHDAWGLCVGAAEDMRDAGEQLDRISNNIAGMYAAKAGGEASGWRDAMLAETWYSAEEAVAAGLADRVDGAEPAEDDEAANRFDLSVFAHAGRAAAPAPAYLPAAALAAPKPPRAAAPGSTPPAAPAASGDTTQEGAAAVFTEEQLNNLRQTVGVANDADGDTVLAALAEALEERADGSAAATPPEGMVQLDQGAYDQLVADASAGREARNQQLSDQRASLVEAAVNDGRIPPSRREHWTNLLEADPGAATTLANLAKGTVPLDEVGHAGSADNRSAGDDVYAELFPEEA